MKDYKTIKRPQIEMSGQEENIIDDWMNSKETAKYLSISNSQLMNLTSNGKVPFYKFGRSNRYKKLELNKFLESEPRGLRDDNKV